MYIYMYISAYKIVFITFSVREPCLPPRYALAAVSVEFSCSLHDLQTAAWYGSVVMSIHLEVYGELPEYRVN